MSRIGRKPVEVPKGIVITAQGGVLTGKGPGGELTLSLPEGIVARWTPARSRSRRARMTPS